MRKPIALFIALMVALTLGLVSPVPVAAATNLVVNGSFETPILSDNNFGWYTSGVDWTVIGSPGVEIQSAWFLDHSYLAYDGRQFAELDSDSNGSSNTTIYQDVPTAAVHRYLLTFYWAARPGHAGDNQIQVNWNEGAIFISPLVPAEDAPEGSITWHEQTFIVTGAGDTTKLEFIQLGPQDSVGTYLDAVSVEEISSEEIVDPTPTPTPTPGDVVGGYVYPVNKTSILTPWLALAAIILAGGIFLVRRRVHS